MNTKNRKCRFHNERGAAFIELALWLPVFFLVLSAMLFYFETLLKVIHAETSAMANVLERAQMTEKFGEIPETIAIPLEPVMILQEYGFLPTQYKRTIWLYYGSIPGFDKSKYSNNKGRYSHLLKQ